MAGTDDIFDTTLLRKLIDEQVAELAKRLTLADLNTLLSAADGIARRMVYIHLHRAELEAKIGKEDLEEAETYCELMLSTIEPILAAREADLVRAVDPAAKFSEEFNGTDAICRRDQHD